MSFQQGLSGLNAAAKNLDVIGNNVANASTVGFKQSQAQFADVYANSLTGAGGAGIGIGTKVAQVSQQFTQGNISSTNNPLDIAINGGGFFRMDNNGEIAYQRNGQFQLDRMGFIVNPSGGKLTGYMANANGVLATGSPVPLSINTADLVPQVTSQVNAVHNFNSNKTPLLAADFDMADPTTYHDSTALSVYDSLGNEHTLQTFYVKSAAGTWDVFAANDGVLISGSGADGQIGTLSFNDTGALTGGSPLTISGLAVTTGATALDFTIDFTDSTQFGSAFSINTLNQDGYTSGRLASFNVGADGVVLGLRRLHQHLGGGVFHLHLPEDRDPVVGDRHVSDGVYEELVHPPGAEGGPDRLGHSPRRHDVVGHRLSSPLSSSAFSKNQYRLST